MNFARDGNFVGDGLHGLVEHLRDRITTDAVVDIARTNVDSKQPSLRSIWESSDLSADEFADEIAGFFKYPRIQLPDLLAASTLADRFSARFLRESMMFPFEQGGGQIFIAVADPTDEAALRGAQIVLGEDLAVTIASFDDVAAVLSKCLIPVRRGWLTPAMKLRAPPKTASKVYAISPAAPRWFAQSMIFSRKRWIYAQAIFTSSLCAIT